MQKLFLLVLLVWGSFSWLQAQETDRTVDTVRVVEATPQAGTAIARDKIPSNIRVVNGQQINLNRRVDATAFLTQTVGSVHRNEPGGNILQPDISYRGFTASPLLGLPQGLAVYQDGIRLNEPFGDVVNWDMIPEAAIDRLTLMPGSNPVYGLNALGGALSLRTKSGFSHAEHGVELAAGNFGRLNAEAYSGGNKGRWGYFVSGNFFREDGFRDFSQSYAGQGFGKLTYLDKKARMDLSATVAQSDLRGNGATPAELLATGRQQVFTHPDNTQNFMTMVNWQGEFQLGPRVKLNANAYLRQKNTDTFNGDDSDYEECEDIPGRLCLEGAEDDDDDDEEEEEEEDDDDEEEEEGEEPVFDQDGNPVAALDELIGGTNNRSETRQLSYGGNVQLNLEHDLLSRKHKLMVGVSFDGAQASYNANTELVSLTEERGTTETGVFDRASFVEVDIMTSNASAFFLSSYELTERISMMLSTRLNYSQIVLKDQLGEALNGDHEFVNVNPSAGFTWEWQQNQSVYASASVSNRTPTPVELTCADEDAPCRLPNAFLADPPLDPVIAFTLEAGARGQLKGFAYSASYFRTRLDNDIYFISAGPARNSGFFDNIGPTLREGVELSLYRPEGRFTWYAHYTFLNATFRSDFTVSSPNNPAGDEGEVEVEIGDRIPLIPQHIAKLGGRVSITESLDVGLDAIFNGNQYFRGDEGNLLDPLDPYVLLGANVEYSFLNDRLSVFLRVNNLLNTEYETMGLFGEPDEVPGFEDFEDSRFLTPGTPISGWLGIEFNI